MNYKQALENLFTLLEVADQADSDSAESWQLGKDSSEFFDHLAGAIKSIAGEKILEHFYETNEVDLTLASRRK